RGRTNYDLWTTDGTAGGTTALLEEIPTPHRLGDLLVFGDGEVTRSDGTPAGTFTIAHDARVLGASDDAAYVAELTASNGQHAIWKTDGTTATRVGAVPFLPTGAGASGDRVIVFSGRAVWAIEAHGAARQIAAIDAAPVHFLHAAGLLFFSSGSGVWRSDGTEAGTFRVAETLVTPPFLKVGGKAIWWGNDGRHGIEPWISDGTHEGTRMIVNLAEEQTIRGRVTDRDTGLPVTDVVIEHDSGTVSVDEQGRYVIEHIGGYVTLTARPRAEHHFTKRIEVPFQAGGTIDVDFELIPAGRIAGRVTGANGSPIANATVLFATSLASEPQVTVRTGSNGRYVTPLLDPRVKLVAWATAPGYARTVFDGQDCSAGCDLNTPATIVSAIAGTTREDVGFILYPPARLRGRILDAATGQPVTFAVELQGWRGWTIDSGVQVRAQSNRDGTYELPLPEGKYWVRVVPPPFTGYEWMWYPDVSCSDCIAPRGTLIEPARSQVIEHDFVLRKVEK
ncbi:MAG TPA: carboxypeptidase regulatory-like domain-containing protein, partial [Thermoanaerobaculia bacterium]|nr:carboxypeptidase regulatory-like domain-containing protein [Thermoanaerobaculia bacterium]